MNYETFLYDTFALIEILKKNPNYEKYTKTRIIINEFIFAEFCYKLFLEKIKNAEEYLDEIIPAIVRPDAELIKKAMKFRIANIKKRLSMTDCISYVMSRKLNVKFLTGDKEFEEFDNVEFVR